MLNGFRLAEQSEPREPLARLFPQTVSYLTARCWLDQ